MSAGARLPGTPEPMHYWQGDSSLRIAGDSWGQPDRPIVVLQHGGGQTRHAWKGAGEALAAAGYFAVAFDARGHGDSDWATAGTYDLDAMVRDLQLVLAAWGARPAVLVGASMGGAVSLLAIGEARLNAAALVLVDVAPRLEIEGIRNIDAFMGQKPEGFNSLDEVSAAIANYQPHRKRPRNLDGLAKNVRLGADGKYRWHWDPLFRGDISEFQAFQERLEQCARKLTIPTLLVRGGLSDLLSEAGAQAFLNQCPHSEYVNVTGAAHMVAGDRNDVFANAVIEFLKRAVPSAPHPVTT